MAKAVFLSGYITFDSTTVYITNLDFNESHTLIDVTDLDNDVDLLEYKATKKKQTFSAEGWKDINTGSLVGGYQGSLVLDFEGYQLTGYAIITSVGLNAIFDGAIRVSFNGVVNGELTETVAT